MAHHHHHHSHGGNGLASLLAIVLLVLLGLLGWGCVELGFALGLGGGLAFLAGAGIVIGGIVAAVAIGIGIYALVEFCKGKKAESSIWHSANEKEQPRHNNTDLHSYFSSGYKQAPSYDSTTTSVEPTAPAAPEVGVQGSNDYDSVRIQHAKK